jgi:hypothetical protein
MHRAPGTWGIGIGIGIEGLSDRESYQLKIKKVLHYEWFSWEEVFGGFGKGVPRRNDSLDAVSVFARGSCEAMP